MKRIARRVAIALVILAVLVTAAVEVESPYRLERVGGIGPDKALVLYHPSRDARFSDDISLAFAEGLAEDGFLVERATTTSESPDPSGYALVAIVSNTYWWTPDLPTLRYLGRARFNGVAAFGIMAGAGSTGRAQRMLEHRLESAGATVVDVQPLWLWRPNDEARPDAPNRQVALDKARRFGVDFGRAVLQGTLRRPGRDRAPGDSAARDSRPL